MTKGGLRECRGNDALRSWLERKRANRHDRPECGHWKMKTRRSRLTARKKRDVGIRQAPHERAGGVTKLDGSVCPVEPFQYRSQKRIGGTSGADDPRRVMCSDTNQQPLRLRIFVQKERIRFNDRVTVVHDLRRPRSNAVGLDSNYLFNRSSCPSV